MRFITQHGVVALVVAAVLSGCSGGEQQEQEQVFTAADATRIANVRPVTPGWTAWPQNPEKQRLSWDSSTESVSLLSQREELALDTSNSLLDPLLVEVERQLTEIDELGGAGNRWRDDDKLGNLSVNVFGSASDAHEAMAALNAFSRGWAKSTGLVTKDEEIGGLGDEAWILWLESYGYQVTYHWRRGNLVVEAHVHCSRLCPDDVDAATRAWVDAIDEEARSAGG